MHKSNIVDIIMLRESKKMSDDFIMYNGIWASSKSVIHEDDYKRQQSYISHVPLEGSNGQITFVYDNDIEVD